MRNWFSEKLNSEKLIFSLNLVRKRYFLTKFSEKMHKPRSRITVASYCHGVKKIITRLIFNQSFQTMSEFWTDTPVKKMRYWSLNLVILEDDGSNNNVQKPWKMAIFWVPLEIGYSKMGEFLLKETTYVSVPHIFFFNI